MGEKEPLRGPSAEKMFPIKNKYILFRAFVVVLDGSKPPEQYAVSGLTYREWIVMLLPLLVTKVVMLNMNPVD